MVLAAGFGTRLRPLSDERPKPLVPVGDRTALEHIVDAMAAVGIERVVVNSHHGATAFDRALWDALALPAVCSHEPEILGTAGGVAQAAEALGEGERLVWNGDILAELDLAELFRAHEASGAAASLAVASPPAGRGTVGLDGSGRVVRLRSVELGGEQKAADFVGIQILSARLRARLPEVGCLVGDVYLPAMGQGLRLQAVPVVRQWTDIGSTETYLAANLGWLAATGKARFVGPGAKVPEEVELVDAVVGAGARITGRGPVHRCVLWPGARARAPLDSAVVTTAGTVVRVRD